MLVFIYFLKYPVSCSHVKCVMYNDSWNSLESFAAAGSGSLMPTLTVIALWNLLKIMVIQRREHIVLEGFLNDG